MVNRCILIFPDFPNMALIEEIRAKYDPAAALVRPHITLVFPFDSSIGSAELEAHVRRALAGMEPFRLCLGGISAQRSFGNYLLLNVHTGKNTIKDMHRRLYTGMLEQYKPQWCRSFEPHMTVGKVEDDGLFAEAVEAVSGMTESFEACIDEISIEIIGTGGISIIESSIKLPVQ